MADKIGKPTAQTYSAGGNKEVAAGPLQWSDKCFLCGTEIGEIEGDDDPGIRGLQWHGGLLKAQPSRSRTGLMLLQLRQPGHCQWRVLAANPHLAH